MGTSKSQYLTIVLAEDDEGHAELILRNFDRAGMANPVVRAKSGQDVMDLLATRSDVDSPVAGPLLLILDIKMPKMDGMEVLRRVKSEPETSKIPVIMLTTTDDPREIERCYQLGCNVYITKPVDYDHFIDAVKRLGLFLQLVQVPVNGK